MQRIRLLWIVGYVLPDSVDEGDERIVFGGWVSEMVRELSKRKCIELGVAMKAPVSELIKKEINSVTYYFVPEEKTYDVNEVASKKVLEEFEPELLHAEGSEQAYTNTFLRNHKGRNVVSMQGVINCYEPYEYGGLNIDNLLFTFNPRDFLFGLSMIINKKGRFKNRLKIERDTISRAQNILGRTLWDRSQSFAINQKATYFFCARNLRKPFYEKRWDIDKKEDYSIFIGNSASPRKGAHFVLEAVAQLKREFPHVKLYIAGGTPYPSSALDWKKRIGYSNYLLRLVKKLDLRDNVEFLGILNEEQMSNRLSCTHVYIMASIIENSPNTLGEAMIMGVPSVSSFNGGVPSMATDNIEVLYYRDNDPRMMAFQIRRIFMDNHLAQKLSKNSRVKALYTHDREKNVQLLLDAYEEIMKQEV